MTLTRITDLTHQHFCTRNGVPERGHHLSKEKFSSSCKITPYPHLSSVLFDGGACKGEGNAVASESFGTWKGDGGARMQSRAGGRLLESISSH